MSVALSVSPTQIIAQHLSTLREYARRVLVQGESLTLHEVEDKARRMEEFVALTTCYKCTAKEQVGLLYEGLFNRDSPYQAARTQAPHHLRREPS